MSLPKMKIKVSTDQLENPKTWIKLQFCSFKFHSVLTFQYAHSLLLVTEPRHGEFTWTEPELSITIKQQLGSTLGADPKLCAAWGWSIHPLWVWGSCKYGWRVLVSFTSLQALSRVAHEYEGKVWLTGECLSRITYPTYTHSLQPWKRRQNVPLKQYYSHIVLHNVQTQETAFWTLTW